MVKNLLVQQILKETVGINDDTVVLSDFLVELLKNKQTNSNQIIINKQELPKLKQIRIKELIINFIANSLTTYKNYVDIQRSYIDENGEYTIFCYLMNTDKETIYHEVNHILQLVLKGKTKSITDFYNIKAVTFVQRILSNEHILPFIDLLIKAKESEINALVAEVYPLVKDIKTKTEFITTLNNSNAYLISQELINYNIFDEFNNIDEYDKGLFFEYVPKIRNLFYRDINGIQRNIIISELANELNNETYEPPSTDITNKKMNKYQKYINKQGTKLQKKLSKLSSLLNLK